MGKAGGRQHPFLLTRQQPGRLSQQRLYAAVDTEEKEKEAAVPAVVVDEKAQAEMERLLAEGTDLLGLVDHLKANKGRVRLTWAQVSLFYVESVDRWIESVSPNPLIDCRMN
jgi:hypothetical protein